MSVSKSKHTSLIIVFTSKSVHNFLRINTFSLSLSFTQLLNVSW